MLNLIISIALIFSIQQPENAESIVKKKLNESAICWNEGNLECFMQTYWKSDSVKFISGTRVTYGWENTLQNYKVGYPTKKEQGELTFTFLSFEQISKDACFIVGQYHLKREAGDDNGHFSLLWRKIEGDWVIVADHSSN